jgi:hypothetical protein
VKRRACRRDFASGLGSDADTTMRAFVLNALKDKGLDVQPDDLLDLRRERPS